MAGYILQIVNATRSLLTPRFGDRSAGPGQGIARLEEDDETVDRRIVSSGKKACLCTNHLSENDAGGSHHGLAATAVHSREAGYIYATVVVAIQEPCTDGADHTFF
jgi:hypothetical protein